MVKLEVRELGYKSLGSDKSSIHSLESSNPGESSYGAVRHLIKNYDSDEHFYHFSNLTCPYCNVNSNIILPIRSQKDPSNALKPRESDSASRDLSLLLSKLLEFQTEEEKAEVAGELEKDRKLPFDLVINLKNHPILQQISPLTNLFNDMLPYNIPTITNLAINGIRSISPLSILLKLVSDSIMIDVISQSEEETGPTKTSDNGSRILLYSALRDSLEDLIGSFPVIADLMLEKLFELLANEHEMDIWDFISLQSPSSRLQILVSFVTILYFKKTSGSKSSLTAIAYVLLTMLVLEVFSIVWAFWNPEWEKEATVLESRNPIVQKILELKRERKRKRSQTKLARQGASESRDSNESQAFSFFQKLVDGTDFYLQMNISSGAGKVKYTAGKIVNPTEAIVNVNSFGPIPVQIVPATSYTQIMRPLIQGLGLTFENSYYYRKKPNGLFEPALPIYSTYPNFKLDAENTCREIGQNKFKDERDATNQFSLKDFRDLKEIVNLGLSPWFNSLSKLELLLPSEKQESENSSESAATRVFRQHGPLSELEEQIYFGMTKISSIFGLNKELLEMTWSAVCDFNCDFNSPTQNDGSDFSQLNSFLVNFLSRSLFVKLISSKTPLIPLTSLNAFVIDNSGKNSNICVLNRNINSNYKIISAKDLELVKRSLLELGNKKYIHLYKGDENGPGREVLIFHSFNQSIILTPKMFHNLYNKLLSTPTKHPSKKFNNNINHLLICLSCGGILCTEFNCCNETESSTSISCYVKKSYFYCYRNEDGNDSPYSIPSGSGFNITLSSVPIRNHITKCGKGLCLFLHVASSIVLSFRVDISSAKNDLNDNFNIIANLLEPEKSFLSGGGACEYATLYVDEYGEEDKHLARGKPLILSPFSNEDIQGFMSISGCNDVEIAKVYLEMFPGNMNNAINEYFSNLGNEAANNTSNGNQDVINEEEDVRTPIPSFNDQLIPDGHHMDISASPDLFTQNNLVSNSNSISPMDDFSSHMFSPPENIMFNQSFEAAKETAKSHGKLILVNIQSPREFSSMILNRDIWNDSLMVDFIQEHFVFWQRACNTPEGKEWLSIYNISKLPHVSVVDPRTGRQLKTWDVEKSFSDSISASSEMIEFLESENTLKTIRRISNNSSSLAGFSAEYNTINSGPKTASTVPNATTASIQSQSQSTDPIPPPLQTNTNSSANVNTNTNTNADTQVEVPRMNSELAILHMERMKRKNSERK
ncbi:putative zinc finger in N-recognin (UBR box) family protein [Cryptosporidium felis]|nr:putative zinc finger in N-recognin (UBR box) family protein [Cryptosporidium felis]